MTEQSQRIVDWVAAEVVPHERFVRAKLRSAFAGRAEIDDVVQEAYYRMSLLTDVTHITNPRAYLFQTARNIVLEQMRRARIVRLEALTEIEASRIMDDEPSPERVAVGRRELARVLGLIASLPDRCRTIVELRKIHGLSQREIAQRLGVSEHIVENDAARGLRHILKTLSEDEADTPTQRSLKSDERTVRKRH